MNKLFYFLLFCSISGAGVLWWLMNSTSSPGHEVEMKADSHESPHGLVIDEHSNSGHLKANKDVEAEHAEIKTEDQENDTESPKEDLFEAEDEQDSGAKHSTKPEDSKHENLAHKSGESSAPTSLSINSSPVSVNVIIDGEKAGVTPFETKLKTKVQKFRFEKEGYVPVEREAPAEAKPEGAFMSWRIAMVEQQLPPSQKTKLEELQSYFLKGTVGPVFVQVKALDQRVYNRSDVVDLLREHRKNLKDNKVISCEVNLGAHGKWFRILVGPFISKPEASQSLEFISKSLNAEDTFVTGAQTCL